MHSVMTDNLYKEVNFYGLYLLLICLCHRVWVSMLIPMPKLCSCSWKHLKVVLFSNGLYKRHTSGCICEMFVHFEHVNISKGWKLGPKWANSCCNKIWYSMKSSTLGVPSLSNKKLMQDGNISACLTVIVNSNYFRLEFASIYFSSKSVKKPPYGKQSCVDEIMFLSYHCTRLKKTSRLENLLKLYYILYL